MKGKNTSSTCETITKDWFLGHGVCVFQSKNSYRAGLDAVLLAASIYSPHNQPQRLLDVGAGVGTVGLCVAYRNPTAHVTLVEQNDNFIRLARKNINANQLKNRMRVINADVCKTAQQLAKLGLQPESYDQVFANPPYNCLQSYTPPSRSLKQAACSASDTNHISMWIQFMTRMLKHNGSFTIIHKAESLDQILMLMKHRYGAIQICPVQPRKNQPAKRILVSGKKGSRTPLTIHPGLVLHKSTGRSFSPKLHAVLYGKAGLDMFQAKKQALQKL